MTISGLQIPTLAAKDERSDATNGTSDHRCFCLRPATRRSSIASRLRLAQHLTRRTIRTLGATTEHAAKLQRPGSKEKTRPEIIEIRSVPRRLLVLLSLVPVKSSQLLLLSLLLSLLKPPEGASKTRRPLCSLSRRL